MSKFEVGFSLCGSAVTAFCCAAFGGVDAWLRALLTVIVIDYITGVVGAVVQGNLDSRVGYKGICKKMMMLCVVAMAVQADNVIGTGAVLRGMAVGFYLANESLSILENAARIGVPVPKGLVNKLEQMKDDDHDHDHKPEKDE